jgi:hypothetical protein
MFKKCEKKTDILGPQACNYSFSKAGPCSSVDKHFVWNCRLHLQGTRKAERNRGHAYKEERVDKGYNSDTGPVVVEVAWRERGNISSKNSSEEKISSAEKKVTIFDVVSGSRPYISALFSCAAHHEDGKCKFLRNVCNYVTDHRSHTA